ncbi:MULTISPECIES: DUF4164 domain-containing protein [unclassified Methylobacterium]|jgi:hypothetical protein|uniref:DUF4164 domain-containing protein n=1 Tax=unclassified Methylobacterium TaxID=2615210 RepID=UPI0006FF5FCB|nr:MULTISPECIES: DUF4164 domain-containing protein [unclassified Methylobacterium]KQO50002.1 hypothetical protein ASF24_23510 [Methylobacterium sp. Leaf86]KQO84793.1 hypothetical protein ASF32_12000 [Methylobacterium sp. Leaf91]MBO1021048.1 DUF4164 domain-containing protein [Methylobacterium sp. SD274]
MIPTPERPNVDHALARLETALTRLEASVTHRLEAEREPGDLETELAIMAEDRARLAAELDAASARLATVEATTSDVGHRLGRAIEAVEGVLAHPRAAR